MKKYLLAIYQPDGPQPSATDLARVMRDVHALRQEMQAAGVWVFAGGLCPPSSATVLRPQRGEVLLSDGPFSEGKEHLGGFTVIAAPDLDAAIAWGRKLAQATTLPIEIRPFQHDSHA